MQHFYCVEKAIQIIKELLVQLMALVSLNTFFQDNYFFICLQMEIGAIYVQPVTVEAGWLELKTLMLQA